MIGVLAGAIHLFFEGKSTQSIREFGMYRERLMKDRIFLPEPHTNGASTRSLRAIVEGIRII
jgi:hypothetical protein